jgi:hypothetical protein
MFTPRQVSFIIIIRCRIFICITLVWYKNIKTYAHYWGTKLVFISGNQLNKRTIVYNINMFYASYASTKTDFRMKSKELLLRMVYFNDLLQFPTIIHQGNRKYLFFSKWHRYFYVSFLCSLLFLSLTLNLIFSSTKKDG